MSIGAAMLLVLSPSVGNLISICLQMSERSDGISLDRQNPKTASSKNLKQDYKHYATKVI